MLSDKLRHALLSILRRVLHHVEESESQKTDKALTTGGKVTVRLQRSIGRVLDKISTSDKLADSRDAKMQLDSIVYGLIANRRTVEKGSEDSNNKDLLSRLIQAEAAGNMSDLQLRDEIMTIFVAGHETTANALTWTSIYYHKTLL